MIENAALLAGAVIKRAILDYKGRLRRYKTLDEWRNFCRWIETLPYSEVITGERDAQAPEADGART